MNFGAHTQPVMVIFLRNSSGSACALKLSLCLEALSITTSLRVQPASLFPKALCGPIGCSLGNVCCFLQEEDPGSHHGGKGKKMGRQTQMSTAQLSGTLELPDLHDRSS